MYGSGVVGQETQSPTINPTTAMEDKCTFAKVILEKHFFKHFIFCPEPSRHLRGVRWPAVCQ